MDADALCQHCTSSYFCCFCKERILFGQFFPNLGWLVSTFSIWTIFNLKFKGRVGAKNLTICINEARMILDFYFTQSPAIAIYIFTFLLVGIVAPNHFGQSPAFSFYPTKTAGQPSTSRKRNEYFIRILFYFVSDYFSSTP